MLSFFDWVFQFAVQALCELMEGPCLSSFGVHTGSVNMRRR